MRIKLDSKPLSLQTLNKTIFIGTFDGILHKLEDNNKLTAVLNIKQPISEIQFILASDEFKGIILSDWHGTLHYFKYEFSIFTKMHEIFLQDNFIKSFLVYKEFSFVGCNNSVYIIKNTEYKIIKEINLGNSKALFMQIIPHNLNGCIICGLNDSTVLIINEDFTYKTIPTGHRQSITDITFSKEDIFSCSLDGTIRKNFEEIIFNKKGYVFQYNEIGLIAVSNKLFYKEKIIFKGKRNVAKFILIGFVVYGICYDGCFFIINLDLNEEESSDI